MALFSLLWVKDSRKKVTCPLFTMQAVIHWALYQQISSPLRGSKEMLILAFGWVLASVSIHLHAIPEGAPDFSRPSCECACIWINEHEQDCYGSCYGICGVLQSGLAKLTWPLHPAVSSDSRMQSSPPDPPAPLSRKTSTLGYLILRDMHCVLLDSISITA